MNAHVIRKLGFRLSHPSFSALYLIAAFLLCMGLAGTSTSRAQTRPIFVAVTPVDEAAKVSMTAPPPCDDQGLPSGWGSYALHKNSNFTQLSEADPLPEDRSTAFTFSALVTRSQLGGDLDSASVTLPNAKEKPLLVFGGMAQFVGPEPTDASLNNAYPAGIYLLRFKQAATPERVILMSVPIHPAPVPKILNFVHAQAINAGADFTLQWNGFPGAGNDDHLLFSITDSQGAVVFQATDRCAPRELPVTATSIVIPAATLRTNETYFADLTYQRLFYDSTNAVPQMAGFGDLSRKTSFTVKTAESGAATAATLSFSRLLLNGNPQFLVTGTPVRSYGVERTRVLPAQTWISVGNVLLDSDGHAVFEDTEAGKTFPLYYRVVTQ